MEWIFVTAVLVLFVYHATFRRWLVRLALVAVLVAVLGYGALFGYVQYTNHQEAKERMAHTTPPQERQALPVTLPDLPDRPPVTEQDIRDAQEAREAIARLRDQQARRDRIAALEARVNQPARQESVEERWQRLMRESRHH